MSNASLHDRMKGYEMVSKNHLTRRIPVIVRIDGKAFGTFTKNFKKPFDNIMTETMQETMKFLCENIQGCVLGYTQSDEISLVICDYQKINTDAWLNYSVQKITSISASMATMKFNQLFKKAVDEFYISNDECDDDNTSENLYKYLYNLEKAANTGAMFDARAFNIPVEEVNNCLLWRQQDATRNSVQSLARTLFSQKEIAGIKNDALQDKMFNEKGVNWNNLPIENKHGSCCVKDNEGHWYIDYEIPIFSQDTDYVNSRITFNEEYEWDEVFTILKEIPEVLFAAMDNIDKNSLTEDTLNILNKFKLHQNRLVKIKENSRK